MGGEGSDGAWGVPLIRLLRSRLETTSKYRSVHLPPYVSCNASEEQAPHRRPKNAVQIARYNVSGWNTQTR